MSVLPVGIAASGDEAYTLDNSLRFRSSASAYLSRTPASDGNRKTWTWSAWVKRGTLGSYQSMFNVFDWASGGATNNQHGIRFDTSDKIEFWNYSGGYAGQKITTQVFRDVSAWYHVVAVWDTSNATASNRMRLYINGSEVTSFGTSSDPAQNTDGSINRAFLHTIGTFYDSDYSSPTNLVDGYLTEINFIDGQALDPTDFGEFDATTGVWKPKAYSGTYGTNGFYLPTTATTQAEGFNTVLWTGNGTSQSIKNVGFNPDFVWVKTRTSGVGNTHHFLFDTVRGAPKRLFSSSASAEVSDATELTSFDTDGFSVGSDISLNGSGESVVGWCWDAGSGSPASNTDGDITSTVKANDATGFSIVSYTGTGTAGATIGHGLSSAPEMVMVKRRDSTGDWLVWNETIASSNSSNVLFLNDSAGATANSSNFNSTAPTSSVFTVGSNPATNSSGGTHIAYCWHSVAGYSKFDSYTGTGVAGLSVTTGFRPAFVMIKRTDVAGQNWNIVDGTRSVVDPRNLYLSANLSDVEKDLQTTASADFLNFTDTGFEVLNTGGYANASGGTYIYMAFADTRDAQFNFDASGNKNNWTPNNINSNASSESSYDIMTDVPTLTDENTANYATLNALIPPLYGSFSEGNLKFETPGAANWGGTKSTIAIPETGKWYGEFEITSNTSNTAQIDVGIFPDGNSSGYSWTGSYGLEANNGFFLVTNGSYSSNAGSGKTAGDIFQIAVDADAGNVWFGVNNSWYDTYNTTNGNPSSGTNPSGSSIDFSATTFFVGVKSYLNGFYANFGQRPFAYTPPTGFKSLNTYNLPDSTIEDGSEYFNTVLYSGDGTNDRAITGVGFQPDFTWLKARNDVADHTLFDAVRGAGSDKALYSNGTYVEGAYTAGFDAFLSDGFQVDNNVYTNSSSNTYASWNWKANGSGVSNTIGDTNATVSANTTSGFSIVSFNAGAAGNHTVGHGLGVTPEMIIMKDRNSSGYGNWTVFHSAVCTSTSNYLLLNGTGALGSVANSWGSALPTSTVFGFGSNVNVAANDDIIAYCFAGVEGFSAFGSYTGNGSADGPFIYTGFRPAWVMVKASSTAGYSWNILDTARDTYNTQGLYLFANTNGAEGSGSYVDVLSNGFKLRNAGAGVNGSGITYIYAAFAENPFKNSLAR